MDKDGCAARPVWQPEAGVIWRQFTVDDRRKWRPSLWTANWLAKRERHYQRRRG